MQDKLYFISHKDLKTKKWVENHPECNIIQLSSSPYLYFLRISLISILNRKHPIFYFRYLNDYKSIIMQSLRIVTDFFLIFCCYILRGEIRWIVHNIDRDTIVNHKLLNKFRRNYISFFSKIIFVTDPELMQVAVDKIGYKRKIQYITFGEITKDNCDNINANILEKIDMISPNIYVGLCATALVDKCEHLKNLETTLDQANSFGDIKVIIVLVANFRNTSSTYIELRERLKLRKDIILYDEGGNINEGFLAKRVNFIYRSLSDYSVPFSLYNSTSARLPILTHDIGFCGMIVEKYNLGYVIKKNFDFDVFNSFMSNWNEHNAIEFLSKRSWAESSRKLFGK
jgi:hypothetical protein